MSHRIITIGREFGSNGRLIGQKLTERLQINFYDKDLIELAARHTDELVINEDLLFFNTQVVLNAC